MAPQCSPRRQGGRYCTTVAAALSCRAPAVLDVEHHELLLACRLPLVLLLEARGALGLRCGCTDRAQPGPEVLLLLLLLLVPEAG